MTINKFLFQQILLFSGNQLLYNGHLIHDFSDPHENISTLSVKKQLDLWLQIVDSIYDTSISEATKAQASFLFTYLIKELGRRNQPVSVFCLGKNYFTNLFSSLLTAFDSEHHLYEMTKKEDYQPNQNDNTSTILVHHFRKYNVVKPSCIEMMLVNMEDFVHDPNEMIQICCRSAAPGARVVLFGAGDGLSALEMFPDTLRIDYYPLGSERFVASFTMPNQPLLLEEDRSIREFSQQLASLCGELSPLIDDISLHTPDEDEEKWHASIDHAIVIVSKIETMIIENYKRIRNIDFKYQTNELKLHLLDFKYEASLHLENYSFFRQSLLECYAGWVQDLP
ncbi:hypothetical protein [Paenibacillus sp. B01]|uniref:hypothetical protein n=1 Tax=Paenibacillus sp. B01 TaxID=2660554 RepID=UPI00129A905D|nr:hypothetical protein [Paenibacillus sp. B01]QGG58090.1 hypothetical protein GE073_22615 [Paenibacillus sp. B01]